MTKILAMALLALFPLQALGAFSLKTEIETKEGDEESETLGVEAGKSGSITAGNLTVKLTPVRLDAKTVGLKVEIHKAVAGGKSELLATPSIVATLGEPANISEITDDGTTLYKIRVVPREK